MNRNDIPADWEGLVYGSEGQPTSQLLRIENFAPLRATAIPPRRWAYGHFLMFGQAAVLGAVDGGGKGTITATLGLCVITGQNLLGEKVWRRGPIAIVTYEDDKTEWQRRFAAAILHHGLADDYEDIMAQVHFIVCDDDPVSFGRSVEGQISAPAQESIITIIKEIGAVLLVIDPFNHAHDLEDGNSNAAIAKVAGAITKIAQKADCAALVLHHLRKGSTGAADDLMGATSLRATFRSCRILQRMTPDVAEKMNISDAWRYTRFAGSKENYAPPPEKAAWFKLASVSLGNATDEYPEGDSIAVAVTWQARPAFEGMDAEAIAAVFKALRDVQHCPTRRGGGKRPWAGAALVEIGKRSEIEAKSILRAWLEAGVLVEQSLKDEHRNSIKTVAVDDAKAAAILAELRAPDWVHGDA